MKAQTKISQVEIKAIMDDFSNGLKPIINNLDVDKLTHSEKEELLEELNKLEAKALEVKENLRNSV